MKNMKHLKFIVYGLFLFLISSCETQNTDPITKKVTWEYKYEVTGVGSNDFSITLENTNGQTQQWATVNSGWWYKWNQTLTVDENNVPVENQTRWLYFSAQDNTGKASNVTVKIYRNNQVVSQNTSYGGYTIATVSGNF